MFIDAHIHLYCDEYREILDETIRDAKQSGVGAIFSAAEDYESCLETLGLTRKYGGYVHPVIGLHPWEATRSLKDLGKVEELILKNRDIIVAIGEVGLDRKYAREDEGWDRQVEAFGAMLRASEETGLPVVVHSRKSAEHVVEALESHSIDKVLFHWFSGEVGTLEKIMDRGFFVSFTPSVTYSKRTQRLALKSDLGQVLTETDGPVSYYGEFKGVLTVPSFVVRVVEKMAEVYGLPVRDVELQIMKNASNFFGLELVESESQG